MDLKHLRIVEIGHLDPVKREIATLSHQIEYKLLNPNSERKLITEEEIYEKVRSIIALLEKL